MSSNLVFPTSPTSIKVNNKDLLFCFDFEFNDFQEKNLSMEPYEYFGDVNEILGIRTHQVILCFNADILMRVEMRFKGNVLTEIKQKLEELTIKLPPRVSLNLSFSQTSDHTILIYQKSILNL